MNITKNKKGFTLVELLAVIVILALIMSIAVIAMGNVMENARKSTFKETGEQIISGVQQQLTLNGVLGEGTFYFTTAILDKGGTNAPFGGKLVFYTGSGVTDAKAIVTGNTSIYKVDSTTTTCKAGDYSFVLIKRNGDGWEYSICLTATENGTQVTGTGTTDKYPYLDATRSEVLDTSSWTGIKTAAGADMSTS